MSTPPDEPGKPEAYPKLPAYPDPGPAGFQSPAYGYQGGWQQPVQRPQGTNGFAIASLVCGLLSCSLVLIILAVVFGCVALSQIKRTGQAGRGLAIGGLVAAGVWVTGAVVFIVVVIAHLGTVGTSTSESGFQLKPGDCFDRPADSASATVMTEPCTTAHDAEAFAIVTLSDSTYPDAARLKKLGTRCSAVKISYLAPDRNYPGLSVHYLYPTEAGWNDGTRLLVCFFRTDSGSLTAPAASTGVADTAPQNRYTQAMDQRDQSLEKYIDLQHPVWTDAKEWATGEVTRVQDEITALSGSPWQDGVQPSIDALVAKLRVQLTHWQDASNATGAATTSSALREVASADDTAEQGKARSALGLPSPPA